MPKCQRETPWWIFRRSPLRGRYQDQKRKHRLLEWHRDSSLPQNKNPGESPKQPKETLWPSRIPRTKTQDTWITRFADPMQGRAPIRRYREDPLVAITACSRKDQRLALMLCWARSTDERRRTPNPVRRAERRIAGMRWAPKNCKVANFREARVIIIVGFLYERRTRSGYASGFSR